MARYLAVHISGGMLEGRRVLPEAPVRLTHQLHATQDRNFGPYHRFGWGYGWDLSRYGDETIVHGFGGFSGYRSHMSFMPAHGLGVVVLVITYLSLIVGELVPKQFALRSPEAIAVVMAVPMLWLSRATAPFVWLLDRTSALIFRLLGLNRESSDQVTAEDLHLVVAEAATAGVLEESERAIISGVVRLADRPTRTAVFAVAGGFIGVAGGLGGVYLGMFAGKAACSWLSHYAS